MTEDEKIDMWCVGRVNSLGDPCPEGSYIGLIYSGRGARVHMRISTGHAENLIAELQAALRPTPEKPKSLPPGTTVSASPPV